MTQKYFTMNPVPARRRNGEREGSYRKPCFIVYQSYAERYYSVTPE